MHQVSLHEDVPVLSDSCPMPTDLLLPVPPPFLGLLRHFFLLKNNNLKKKKKAKNTCTFQKSCVEPAAGLSGSQQQNCANPTPAPNPKNRYLSSATRRPLQVSSVPFYLGVDIWFGAT